MPTITCSHKDLQNLVRRQLPEAKLRELLQSAKAELEQIHGDELSISCGDTNLPYLWSVEGLARFLRGILGLQVGITELKTEKQQYNVLVDPSVNIVRPYIACFVAKGPALTEELLIQLIQIQEKLSESFGRKRSKVSIGLYPCEKIQFPVIYKAVDPESVKFIPLEGRTEQTLSQILKTHPKGMQYNHILTSAKRYPVLTDSAKQVLSFPPIINSANTGMLKPGVTEIFFDATGTDQASVELVASIVANALADRKYKIHSCMIKYGRQTVLCPETKSWKWKFNEKSIEKILGIQLSKQKIHELLQKAGYDYKPPFVFVPSYRKDILHDVDIVEDIIIMYGYTQINSKPLTTLTIGKPLADKKLLNNTRLFLAGLGFQECMSAMLSNKELLSDKMQLQDKTIVEIENPVSGLYDVLRNWLTPLLLDVLSKNKHVSSPQRVFEQGLVVRKEGGIVEENRVAGVVSHASTDYTEIRKDVDFLLRKLSKQYTLIEEDYTWLIPGRSAKIIVNQIECGLLGEVHPEVLKRFGIENPVSCFEINLSKINS
ncbi:MAG: phenylalanine--tRNA ligase subunit beta [Candidatus Woesearchaeota archaeon]|nr:phenylalanine--tRNA ligase subunit beta [Candidatus Woesearchaeota archaeon]